MARKTKIVSVSLPEKMAKAIDLLSEEMDQTRSELIRDAVRDYLIDAHRDRERFLEIYAATRGEKMVPLEEFRKECGLI